MRHLCGAALAVALAAVMFFAGAWGYFHLLTLPAVPGEPSALPAGGGSLLGNSTTVLALAAVIGTAVLAGLLAAIRRVSPLATALPGALLLAWTALYLVSVRQAATLIPLRDHAFGAGWEGLLFNGILGAAGAVLVIPALLPSRWRPRGAAGPRTPGAHTAAARRADEQLAAVWPRSRQPESREDLWPEEPRPEDEPALSGTVLGYPGGAVRPVDTTRITGASRVLRATGSFPAMPGPGPGDTGSFPAPGDNGRLGRPYYRSGE